MMVLIINHIWLVVEPTPLKNMKVSWDDYSQYMEIYIYIYVYQIFQTTNQGIAIDCRKELIGTNQVYF